MEAIPNPSPNKKIKINIFTSNDNRIQPNARDNTYEKIANELSEELESNFLSEEGKPSYEFKIYVDTEKPQILLKVVLIEESKLNPRRFPIYFDFFFNPPYPKNSPIILCKSHFCFPSIFDNRNLSRCLIKKWNAKQPIKSVISIIENIPYYIDKLDRDKANSLLYLEGDYDYSFTYNINDFILNNENILFKIKEDSTDKNNEIFFLFTDLNIILLSFGKQFKNKGNMLFFGNICDIESFEPLNYNKEDSNDKELKVFIKFKETLNVQFNKALIFKKEDFDSAVIIFIQRKRLIESTFNLIFPIQNMNMENKNYLENILKITQIREKEAEDEKNVFYAKNNLLELYQRIVEYYSANKDDKAKNYILKLQELLHGT